MNKKNFRILVDGKKLIPSYKDRGFKVELFKKPAASFFYDSTPNKPKAYDLVFTCQKSDRVVKRFNLFIEALNLLGEENVSLKVLLIGEYSHHEAEITKTQNQHRNIKITKLGYVAKDRVLDGMDQSKISVCASDRDANPKVIVESHARGLLVLCASDIKGGAFQINSKNGELFSPDPQSLAKAIKEILLACPNYSARESCITLEDAASQLLRLARD